MRLLNTKTLALEEFFDDRDLRYAILSHRWEEEEVTLQDMMSGFFQMITKRKKGFAKIKECCNQALQRDLKYAVCCAVPQSSRILC
jgi:hypothetical protein